MKAIGHKSSSKNLIDPQSSPQKQHRETLAKQREHREDNNSLGNESCDISPDHYDGSGNRNLAQARQSNHMVAKNEGSFIEQVDAADLSSLNPLATGVEVTDRGTNRCSLFDEQNNNNNANSNKRKNNGQDLK